MRLRRCHDAQATLMSCAASVSVANRPGIRRAEACSKTEPPPAGSSDCSAVDDEGEVLDLLVQRRLDKVAAAKLMHKLLKKRGFAQGAGDGQAALLRRGKVENRIWSARHERGWRKNDRAENSRPAGSTTRSEDATFKSPGSAQRSLVCSRRTHSRSTPSHIPRHAPKSSAKTPLGRGEPLPRHEPELAC